MKRRDGSSKAVAQKKQQPKKLHRQQAWSTEELEAIIEPWRLAILKLRSQLNEHCLKEPPAHRRFQNRRLIKNFYAEYHSSPAAGKSVLMSYWLFCGSPAAHLFPYKEARQQHYAELKAVGLSKEFDPTDSERKAKRSKVIKEFSFRLDSLASWIEAQESWIFWRVLTSRPAAWDRHDSKARQRAINANLIRRMRIIANELPDWMSMDFVKSFGRWSSPDWAKILKAAARDSADVNQDDLKLETWVWWRYPIFSRFRWSTAEVCRAAKQKFGKIHHVDHEPAFQLFWVRRGLRFTGKRTGKRHRPPLWDFVVNNEVPKSVSLRYPMLTRIPYGKRPS